MDQESVICDIERRARGAGIAIRDLCIRANVHPTTFSRWKLSEKNPDPLGANLHSIGRLYAVLKDMDGEASAPAPEAHRLCGAAK